MNSHLLLPLIVLLHSIWQLPLLYYSVKLLMGKEVFSPTLERRQLILTIIFQWIISGSSFLIYSLHNSPNKLPSFSFGLEGKNFADNFPFKVAISVYLLFLAYKIVLQLSLFTGIRKLSDQIDFKSESGLTALVDHWSKTLHTNIRFSVSSKFENAFTFGHSNPIIVLPLSILTSFSPEQVESILLHEIAHIKNKDFLVNIFLEISEAIFSFNPFVWIISKEIRIKREQACDEFVIQQNIEPSIYADALFQLALIKTKNNIGLSATGRKKYLLHRIQSLYSYNKNLKPDKNLVYFSGLAAMLLLMVSLVTVPKIENIIPVVNNIIAQESALPDQVLITPPLNKNSVASQTDKIVKFSTEAAIKKVEVPALITSTNTQSQIIDNDETAYDLSLAKQVNLDAEKNKTVAVLQEENADGTVTMVAVEIKIVNGSNQLTPLWKWQSKPITADSIRKTMLAMDSVRQYQ